MLKAISSLLKNPTPKLTTAEPSLKGKNEVNIIPTGVILSPKDSTKCNVYLDFDYIL